MKKTLWVVGLMIMAVIILSPENVQAKTIKKTKYFDLNESNNQYTFPIGIKKAKKIKTKSSNPKVLTVKYKNHKKVGKCIYYKAKKAGTAKITISYTTKGKKKKYIYTYHVIGKGKTVKRLGKQAFNIQNEYRTAKGKKALAWSEELYKFCLYRLKSHGYDKHKHLRQDVEDYFGSFAKMYCISFGENLAPCGTNAKEAMEMWKDSPGHYANIMRKDYKCGAIAYYKDNWIAVFSYDNPTIFKNWKDINSKTKAITVKRIDPSTREFVDGSVIQYYEKDNWRETIMTKSINFDTGVKIFLEIGKTYIIRERDTPLGVDKFEKIEINVTEDSPDEIILK